MVSWLTEIFDPAARLGQYAILATLLFVATLVISFAIALTILIGLPSDNFCTPRAKSAQEDRHGIFVLIGIVLKNLLGVILILVGAILSVPGLPGQGLVTVLAGVLLLDFPGKRRLLYKILRRPPLLQAINRLRMKFSRPPLVVG
jgi:hypothetical protein